MHEEKGIMDARKGDPVVGGKSIRESNVSTAQADTWGGKVSGVEKKGKTPTIKLRASKQCKKESC